MLSPLLSTSDAGLNLGEEPKQNHHCHDCGRQFVQCFEQYVIAEDKRRLIERLLLERLSLRGICRAVGVTLKWLLGFLVQGFEALPDHLHVQPVSCQHDVLIQRLEVEADEMASFVQKKANKQWVWIAMDAKTRQIIAFHVGDRSHTSAEHLWAKIPQAYRHHATFYTDQYGPPGASDGKFTVSCLLPVYHA